MGGGLCFTRLNAVPFPKRLSDTLLMQLSSPLTRGLLRGKSLRCLEHDLFLYLDSYSQAMTETLRSDTSALDFTSRSYWKLLKWPILEEHLRLGFSASESNAHLFHDDIGTEVHRLTVRIRSLKSKATLFTEH